MNHKNNDVHLMDDTSSLTIAELATLKQMARTWHAARWAFYFVVGAGAAALGVYDFLSRFKGSIQ